MNPTNHVGKQTCGTKCGKGREEKNGRKEKKRKRKKENRKVFPRGKNVGSSTSMPMQFHRYKIAKSAKSGKCHASTVSGSQHAKIYWGSTSRTPEKHCHAQNIAGAGFVTISRESKAVLERIAVP